MIGDASIAALVGRGEIKQACSLAYEHHGRAVDRFIDLQVRAAHARDDVRQEVWAAAQKALPSFRFEAPLRTWLLRIAKHKIVDGWRDRPLEQTLDSQVRSARAPAGQSTTAGQLTPSRLLHAKRRVLALRRALARLEDDERELLDMRFALGLKPAEIAHVLGGIAANTVAQRLVRLVRKLHALLRDDPALDSLRPERAR